ncbi:hypothetical protein MN086_04810 [Sulfurovum sp. XGS-02]|uniref:hypothetical protein n=1 Tax=Sulfurovum sp. XGS-02 TaxID=2925411 RepID=UPI00204E1A1C|nr:hypothetical protein [Sulfurovum sp. XGS-02]UPT78472.1 hypothetical protein MN086_04810 [Sulfurovum sp. XGS-02]
MNTDNQEVTKELFESVDTKVDSRHGNEYYDDIYERCRKSLDDLNVLETSKRREHFLQCTEDDGLISSLINLDDVN